METSTPVHGAGADSQSEGAATCPHQWIIDTPAGPSSKGVCRLCGEKREFLNYIEGSSWGSDISLEQLAGGTRFPTAGGPSANKGLADDEETG